MMNDDEDDVGDGMWFAPKRFGYGAGWPVAWQGWALLGGYVALVAALSAWLAPRHGILFYLVTAMATAAFAIICARHTRGGWRWRR